MARPVHCLNLLPETQSPSVARSCFQERTSSFSFLPWGRPTSWILRTFALSTACAFLPFRFPGLSSGLWQGLVVACSGDGFLVVAVWRVWTSHCCAVPSWASLRLKCLCLTCCLLCSLWSGF